MEINQQIMALMGQPEELASYINLQASGKETSVKLLTLKCRVV